MVDFMDDKQLLGELKRGNNAAFEFPQWMSKLSEASLDC